MRTTDGTQRPAGSARDRSAVPAAVDRIERESTILAAELDAFDAFRTRLSKIEPTAASAPSCDGAHATGLRRDGERDAALARVRDAYRETVMAVDHYEDEYGESYAEHLESEFGAELACALLGAAPLSAVVHDRLLAAVSAAIDNRESARETLAREERALERGETRLRAIRDDLDAVESRPLLDCSPGELARLRDDVRALERRCDDVVADRQSGDLHTTATLHRDGARSLSGYLYGPLDVQHPLLYDAATVSERIARAQRRVETHLGATVSAEPHP